ncbi:MAG: hypothetical protein ACR2MW_05570 [Chthoniobacterales bacterium]
MVPSIPRSTFAISIAGMNTTPKNNWLVMAGVLSVAAALLHLAVIVGGAEWYRFFGAGEGMARLAERGSLTPHLITLTIALVLAIWAAYAFAGAGLFPRLPLMRTALLTITAIYLLRGLALFPTLALKPALVDRFTLWSSIIVLVYGIIYAVGTWRAWPTLGNRAEPK